MIKQIKIIALSTISWNKDSARRGLRLARNTMRGVRSAQVYQLTIDIASA
ncbi:MAG: hypothetical protein C4527_00945 [Candidatus Omnitrophota bacterium]|nr:MAG: hypothetical protein C4527_00945 [Candidatus Omnitrophota bacterium]